MNRQLLPRQVMWAIFIMFLLVGCGTPAATPSPTETSTPPSEPLPETVIEFEVIFDGKNCTVTGPTELPPGEHTFIFVDESDLKGELYLVNLDEGKTIQDELDLQSEPGEWHAKPSWVHYDSSVSRETQKSNGRRIDTQTWRLDIIGEHIILCYVSSPQMLWFAAPITVVETTSE